MERRVAKPRIEGGLNSSVDHGGSSYHVQTECSKREAPVIESLVFKGGEALVRITASYDEVARRFGFTKDDGHHLVAQQHADLIRKIRHGMLQDDAASTPPAHETPHFVDAEGSIVDPDEIDEPGLRELLGELGVAIGEARSVQAAEPERPTTPESLPERPRPWWRRLVICIRY